MHPSNNNIFWSGIWKASAVIIGIESFIVVVGWVFTLNILTGFIPDQINMKFATAVAFLFSTIALPFMAKAVNGEKESSQIILSGSALVILLIMATLLMGGLFHIHTGIEDLFVQDEGSAKTVVPGLPATATMLGFILFGVTSIMALFDVKNIKVIVLTSGVVIGLLGALVMIGYLTGIPYLYFDFGASGTPVAVNTGALFFFLGIALIGISKTDHT